MNCEQANNLISARIDGELAGGEGAALDAHLAGCESCRAALAAMELTDAALLRAFSPRQEEAAALADRVSRSLSQHAAAARLGPAGKYAGKPMRWVGLAAAMAAGFALAIIFVKPAGPRPIAQHVVIPVAPREAVAHLTLATGAVFVCPVDRQEWRPIAVHDAIERGAAVRTAAASKCELKLPDGSCVRFNSGTEARFTADRSVQVSAGQLWSALPRDAAPICVSAGQTQVTAGGAAGDGGTQFDLTCGAEAATVAVQCGTAKVGGNVPERAVHGGQTLAAQTGTGNFVCTEARDPVLAARWQDELLVLKPGNDPEVVARVDQLMTRIVAGGGPGDHPSGIERDLRAGGQAWCSPLACYLRIAPKSGDGANRRAAARLLADLAPPTSVPDLIELLGDDDGEVRFRAAGALRRLTGQTLGYPADVCAARRDPAACAAWRKWLAERRKSEE